MDEKLYRRVKQLQMALGSALCSIPDPGTAEWVALGIAPEEHWKFGSLKDALA